jgi:ankyrin repeat protein
MLQLMNKVLLVVALCLFLVCSKNARTPAAEINPTLMLIAKAGTYLPENLSLKRADSSIELDFKELIAKGAKVDTSDEDSNTALLLLAQTTDSQDFSKVVALAKILLENKADVNRANYRKFTALHMACLNGNKPLVELLVANGADIEALDNSSCTPVVYAVTGGGHAEILEFLAKHKADLSWKDPSDNMSLLEIAQRRGYTKTVELLKTRIKPN